MFRYCEAVVFAFLLGVPTLSAFVMGIALKPGGGRRVSAWVVLAAAFGVMLIWGGLAAGELRRDSEFGWFATPLWISFVVIGTPIAFAFATLGTAVRLARRQRSESAGQLGS